MMATLRIILLAVSAVGVGASLAYLIWQAVKYYLNSWRGWRTSLFGEAGKRRLLGESAQRRAERLKAFMVQRYPVNRDKLNSLFPANLASRPGFSQFLFNLRELGFAGKRACTLALMALELDLIRVDQSRPASPTKSAVAETAPDSQRPEETKGSAKTEAGTSELDEITRHVAALVFNPDSNARIGYHALYKELRRRGYSFTRNQVKEAQGRLKRLGVLDFTDPGQSVGIIRMNIFQFKSRFGSLPELHEAGPSGEGTDSEQPDETGSASASAKAGRSGQNQGQAHPATEGSPEGGEGEPSVAGKQSAESGPEHAGIAESIRDMDNKVARVLGCFLDKPDFSACKRNIAAELGIPQDEARTVRDNMEREKLIENQGGKWVLTQDGLSVAQFLQEN